MMGWPVIQGANGRRLGRPRIVPGHYRVRGAEVRLETGAGAACPGPAFGLRVIVLWMLN
jgi:hypothetical protein